MLLVSVADADLKALLLATTWTSWYLNHSHGPVLLFSGTWWETACSTPDFKRNQGNGEAERWSL